MNRRVLVAIDSNPGADEAVRWAADWATREGADLLVAGVDEGGGDGDHVAEPDARLTEMAQRFAGARGRGIRIRAADPAEGIVHFASEQRCELIVCGNAGMHGRKDFLFHNLPNRISHLAHCSVVLVDTSHLDAEAAHPRFHHHRPPPDVQVDPEQFEGRMLGRAAQIGRLVTALGARELVTSRRHRGDLQREARLLRESLEKLGPTFEKLGQMLSTRPDLLAKEFIDELSTLQDDVPPLPHADVVRVMEQELQVPWEDIFDSVEPDPVAAGTIAQVHRAVLGGGQRVVLKIQRPTAEEDMNKDLALLRLFAQRAQGRESFDKVVDLPAIIEHLSDSLQRELDFEQEAANLRTMAAVLAPYPRLAVPRVFGDHSTHRLLVMEEIDGVPLHEAGSGPDRGEAARQLVESYFEQVLDAGFFHADPHPGNLLWSDGRIVLLDLGMVGRLDARTRDLLGFLLLAFWHEDVAFLGDVLLMIADRHGSVDQEELRAELAQLVAKYRHVSLQEFQLGAMLQDLTQLCVLHDIRMPASLALVGKALGQMQLAAGRLDPDLDPFSVAGHFFTRHLTRRVRDMVGPQRFYYSAQKLRLRVTSLFDALERLSGARPGFEPTVNFRGTERLEATLRHAGRRIVSGFMASAAFVICGVTAGFGHAPAFLPALFGAVGGAFSLLLAGDLLRGD